MDYIQYIPTAPQLVRMGASAMNEVFFRLKSFSLEQPRANAEFDISNETGFIPSYPLASLPSEFDFWERALTEASEVLYLAEDESPEALSKRVYGESWRRKIRQGPMISIRNIEHDKRKLQRAHQVLAYLTHYYVHSMPQSDVLKPKIIPKTLAIPLVAVSHQLEIAPVLCYADVVLWNLYPINPELPISVDNMRFRHLFSRTIDEDTFYRASAASELRAVEFLQIIEEFNHLPATSDITTISKISRDLQRVTSIINDLDNIMRNVLVDCDPQVFYWKIRPWYNGADADGPSSPGWIYEGVDTSSNLQLSGPSAGQSSVFHVMDVWLDIDHKLKQRRYPEPSAENKRVNHSFMERMRQYMPGPHREFLQYLEDSSRPVRDIARQMPALQEPYNAAVMALKKFRDNHIIIVCRYIINPSRAAKCPLMTALARKQAMSQGQSVRGTGGNEIAPLLKAGRDATRRAVLQ